jgi:hypothetical protein
VTARELLDAYAASELIYANLPTEDDPDAEQNEQHQLDAFAPKAFAAIRKVLERHRPDPDGDCFECVESSLGFGASPVPYPCATVQDITGTLEETS